MVFFSLLVAVGVVVLQIVLLGGRINEGVVAGDYTVNNEPFAVALLPAVDVTAAGFNGEGTGLALVELACCIHVGLGRGAVSVEFYKDVGHNMVGGDHVAVLVEHVVNELSAGAGGEGGAVVNMAVLCKYRVTELVVYTVKCAAVGVDLIADGFLVEKLLKLFFHFFVHG